MSASDTGDRGGGNARAAILGSVRQALGRGPLAGAAREALESGLNDPAPNLIPARAQLPHAAQVDLFVAMAEEVKASVARVGSDAGVPAAVADYLAQHNLPTDIVMAPDAALDAYPWAARPLLRLRRGKAEETDAVSITGALLGIAETGTLLLTSAAERPTTLNFLPATHIVVLRAEQIVGAYEEGWALLRRQGSPPGDGGFMPRTVNLITGPSRTADIEQRMQLGAHGPRQLHIVIVGGEEG